MNECMEIDKPLISIIVPIYNVEPYIHQCLDSLICQTYSNLEIILVDDGTPDTCGQICDDCAKKDPRITVLHQENQGVSAARNHGAQVANGKYIAFVDADDWIDSDYILCLYEQLVKTNADIAVALETVDASESYLWTGKEALCTVLYQHLFDTAPWGKLIRAEIVKAVPFPKGMFFEDLAIVCQIVGRANRVAALHCPYYHYRQNPTGTMNGGSVSRLLDELKAADMMYSYSAKLLNSSKAAACRKFSSYCQVLLKLPENGFESEKKRIWKYIRSTRKQVLFDSNSRIKNRIAAFASLFGEKSMRLLWKISQKES